ncbi:DUF1194 domain-containing protein [Shimia sp.]|uniref:DUF1194 domain-containing protein n=1 Tax=Shimia sp. TaxID=1954381 RepID=UPI003297777D
MTTATQLFAGCRQALSLGLDVSGSVDADEYRMQLDGLANAFAHPDVQVALLAWAAHPVQISVFEWSGPNDQRLLIPWTEVDAAPVLTNIANDLRAVLRIPMGPPTAIGSAKLFGGALLARKPECWKRTLDISGDGMSNTGPLPRDTRLGENITINALVIGADDAASGDARHADIAALSSYFRAWVIQGPDAFVETALGFSDYERAMVRKLKRELQGPSLATLPAAPATRTGNAIPAWKTLVAARSQ